MGKMMDEIHAMQAVAISRAICMAFVAGRSIGSGKSITESIEDGLGVTEDEFGDYDIDTSDGKFYESIQEQVEEFIRSAAKEP